MRDTGFRRGKHLPLIALLLASTSGTCLAQSATPGATVLDTIVVTAGEDSELQQRLEALAGGGWVVREQDMPDSGNLTLSRALAGAPGVVVQDFFGSNDQPRVQLRGSGLQQNPVERGVLVLQDGLPINRADGSYVVGFANPAQADAIEVYRGHTANRLGATVLGGALNFISATGWTDPGAEIEARGGSFGQAGLSGKVGYGAERYDALFHFDLNRRDGFRDYNESERASVGGNIGIEVSDNITTRIFMGYTDLGFDVSGPLTKSALKDDPEQVFTGPTVTPGGVVDPGPNVVRDRPRREADQFLIGARTSATFDAHLIDVALGYTYTDDMFRFPVPSGIRETEGGDFTGVLRYAYKPDGGAVLPLFETSAQYSIGSASRAYYLNESGKRGDLFGRNDLDATTLSLHAGLNIPLWDKLTVSPAISYSHATRDNDDVYGRASRPTIAYNPRNPTMRLPDGAVASQDTSFERSYQAWSPSLGLSYRINRSHTLFAALSRSFEPPTHDDLLATVNGTPNSSPGRPNPANPAAPADAFATPDLEAQTATTLEAGWRGRFGQVKWDATSYYSWVDNELLSLRDASGTSLGAINAGATRHFGVELGMSAELTDRLSGRLSYTFQDFRFHDDPLRGNNRLAGAPAHVIGTMLRLEAIEGWFLEGSAKWIPQKTPVDNMNTLYADPYVVVDLRTDYRINDHLTVFGEVTNLFDKTYAASTLVVDQARADQAAFLPGDGRAFYAGLKATF